MSPAHVAAALIWIWAPDSKHATTGHKLNQPWPEHIKHAGAGNPHHSDLIAAGEMGALDAPVWVPSGAVRGLYCPDRADGPAVYASCCVLRAGTDV